MRRATLVIAVAALLAGACGETAIPRAAGQELQARVARIRSAVEEGKTAAARIRLLRLSDQVTELLDGGVIDQGTAMEILDAAADVRAALGLAPTVSSTPSESISPSPEEGEEGNGGNAYGKDKDKGEKGHGKDD